MTEATETMEKDVELINKYLPDGLEEDAEDSLFTDRELAAYLLAEETNMTWEEAADLMGITYGTYSGKVGGNVDEKKRRARATLNIVNTVEGE